MPRGNVRRFAPDLVLVLLVGGFVWFLSGDASRPVVPWDLLAPLQYGFVAALAILAYRCAAAEGAPRRIRLSFIAAIVLACLAISLCSRRNDPYFWDGLTSAARAALVREGQSLVASHERFSLFYYFVAFLQTLGDDAVAVVRLGAGLVAMSAFVGLGLVAARQGGRGAGVAAACLAIGAPPLFCLSHWLYIDMFLLAICMGLLVQCDIVCRRPTGPGFALLAALLAASLLTKEYALLALPVCGGIWWLRRRAAAARIWRGIAGARRGAMLVAVGVVLGGLGFAFWRLYLSFWRGLYPPGGPAWGLWPLVIIPGNPHVPVADQLRLFADLLRQNLAQLAGSGLLGFALLGLIEVRPHRRAVAWLVLSGACALAIWPHFQLEPAPLNRLWNWGEALEWLAPAVLVLMGALRLGGLVSFRVSGWQAVMLASTGVAIVYFSLVAKVTKIDGTLQAFLDWRYPLFAYAFLAVLAGECAVRLVALGRARGRPALALACLAPALLMGANLVAGTNYVRQAATYTNDQLLGVREAIALAKARNVEVLTTWPYWYPDATRPLNYGPFRWRDEGVALGLLGPGDVSPDASQIALFDTRFVREHDLRIERPGSLEFTSPVPVIAPLRPGVVTMTGPTVSVVDLGAPRSRLDFAPYREEFARPDPADRTAPVWHGLGDYEIWNGNLTMRWSVADRVEVRLGPARADTFLVALRARAFDGVPDQTVDLGVNDHSLGAIPLATRWQVVRWTIPGDLVNAQAGNRLTITPRAAGRPADRPGASSGDRRRLGVGFDWLQIDPRDRNGAAPAGAR
ncbi:MAG TPA: hypothetical protein PLL30_10860 [Candidatus Krumholzibacteria bacterium]|nr:hypothetical protein [Candidatus Krumholzibacteria bacterium]HPD72264.1 hypothetical protein [Candidatus Krumholzibacteria bacterium]HRY40804.1 hypothetical protein [Candidatus Krumholzibacteria bacterium]